MASIDVTTPPTGEPVDLAMARLHLRLDAAGTPPAHPDDALVSLWIASAREECERYMNRRMMQQTVAITFAGLDGGGALELPVAPVQSVTSLSSVGADGAVTVVPPADYLAVLAVAPPRLVPTAGATWPTGAGAIVEAVVGYASADAVPPPMKAAILLLLGQAYELRESGIEPSWGDAMPIPVARLLAPYRLWLF